MKKLVYRTQTELVFYSTCDEMLLDVQERQKLEEFSRVKKFEDGGCWYAEFEKDLSKQDNIFNHLEELNSMLDEIKRVANSWKYES